MTQCHVLLAAVSVADMGKSPYSLFIYTPGSQRKNVSPPWLVGLAKWQKRVSFHFLHLPRSLEKPVPSMLLASPGAGTLLLSSLMLKRKGHVEGTFDARAQGE